MGSRLSVYRIGYRVRSRRRNRQILLGRGDGYRQRIDGPLGPGFRLASQDEIVALRPEYADGDEDPEVRPACQARPNVIFEAGLAIGRVPDRVILVELGRVRHFSDVMGRHAVRLGNSVASRQEFAVRLRIAGCAVDLSGTDWHTSGDFSPPPQPKVCAAS